MNPIKLEVGQYRLVNKGHLRAFFSLIIYPEGQKILDCRHFVSEDRQWFSFPQKEIITKEGEKDYIPLVSYLNKDYLEQLKAAVMQALKDAKPQGSYGNSSAPGKKNFVQTQSPSSREGLPF